MGYVFISYSTSNQSAADAMNVLLKNDGIKTWMAPGDIPAGSKYAQVINRAVKNCSCMVLMLSNDAQNSVWVAKEVERAVNYRRPIIPVQLEDLVLNDEFELYISTDQLVAVQKIDKETKEIKKLLISIKDFVGEVDDNVNDEAGETKQIYYQNGCEYTGATKDGRPHGHGIMRWKSGTWFEGAFLNGVKNVGVEHYFDGSIYEGEFKNGKKDGHGKYTRPSGDWFEGNYVDGKKEGVGVEHYSDGGVYEGEFKNGKKDGHGRYVYKSGSIYEGNWENGKRRGPGFYTDTKGNQKRQFWFENLEENEDSFRNLLKTPRELYIFLNACKEDGALEYMDIQGLISMITEKADTDDFYKRCVEILVTYRKET